MTQTYPVSAFEPSSLEPEDGRAPVVSPEAWAGGRARRVRDDLNAHLGRPGPERHALLAQLSPAAREAVTPLLQRPPEPPFEASRRGPIRISLAAIRRFLESPLQGSAQSVLGLYEDAQDGLEEELDEPLSFDRFTAVGLLRHAFWAGGGADAETEKAYADAFELRALKGEAPVGLFAELAQQSDRSTLGVWRGNARVLGLDYGDWVHGKLGRAHEHERVDVLLPPIRLSIPVGGELVPVQVVGNLSPYRKDGTATLRCLTNKAVTEKHFLTGFLSTVALALAGGPTPAEFRVGVVPGVPSDRRQMVRAYHLPPRDVAHNWLRTVLSDLLSGVHAYRLPIDQVLKWWPRVEPGRRPRLPFMPNDEFNSDSYGPVRGVWDFPPPSEDEAEDMVRRRLQIWFQAAK